MKREVAGEGADGYYVPGLQHRPAHQMRSRGHLIPRRDKRPRARRGVRSSWHSAYSTWSMGTHPVPGETTSSLFPLAGTVALLLIFLAILLTANEIRFQGCVETSYRQTAINADHPRQAIGIQECSRLPFGA